LEEQNFEYLSTLNILSYRYIYQL